MAHLNWMQQEARQIAHQDAYNYSRDQQRRFDDWELLKERAAEPTLSQEPEFEEDEFERGRR